MSFIFYFFNLFFLFFQLLYLLIHALGTMPYFKLGGCEVLYFKKKKIRCSLLVVICRLKKNQARSQLISNSIRHSSLKKKGSNSFLIFIPFFSFFFFIEDNVKLNFRYLIMLNAWDDQGCLEKKKNLHSYVNETCLGSTLYFWIHYCVEHCML